MRCDNYKKIISNMIGGVVTSTEKQELLHHINDCYDCRNEYEAQLEYKFLVSQLNKSQPKLVNKEAVINGVFDKLDNLESKMLYIKGRKTIYTNSSFRKLVASLAASLIMLFSFQQLSDALKIKQLEEKQYAVQERIDYSRLKLNILINRMGVKPANMGILNNKLIKKSSALNILWKKNTK